MGGHFSRESVLVPHNTKENQLTEDIVLLPSAVSSLKSTEKLKGNIPLTTE
jgi:hypothetical protein